MYFLIMYFSSGNSLLHEFPWNNSFSHCLIPRVYPVLLCIFAGSSCANSVKDLVFVLDSSGSVCNNEGVNTCDNWESILQFVNEIIDELAIGNSETRIGIVVFGNMAKSELYLNNSLSRDDLKNFVLQLDYVAFQNTNTSGALYKVIVEQFISAAGDRENADNELIVITDGVSTVDVEPLEDYVNELLNAGVEIFSVGVTDKIDVNELKLISSPPRVQNQNYFTASTFDTLTEIVKKLTNQSCSAESRYLCERVGDRRYWYYKVKIMYGKITSSVLYM